MAPEERNPPSFEKEGTQEARGKDAGSQEPPDGSQGQQASRGPTKGLIDQLAERGFGVVDDFVDAGLLTQLRWRCSELQSQGALRPAKVGRGANERLEPE